MKKYSVENRIDNCEQFLGGEPHSDIFHDLINDYVEANSEEEAIDFAMDWICERLIDDRVKFEKVDDKIIVYDEDGEVKESYYYFKAEEIEE